MPRPRRFYFVEDSTDEDGHLTDVSGDDLACTDSFDTVEQVALLPGTCCPPRRALRDMPSHLHAVAQFWYYYDHIVRANELPPNTDCCLFRVRAHAQHAFANLSGQRA